MTEIGLADKRIICADREVDKNHIDKIPNFVIINPNS
jgi:hypothetical protein